MRPTRRRVLAGAGVTTVAALAGCMDDGADISVESSNIRFDEEESDGPAEVTFMLETDSAPLDVEIEVTTYDEDDEEVDTFSHEGSIESSPEVVRFEVDTPEEFDRYEYSVTEQ